MSVASASRTGDTFEMGRVVSRTFGAIARNVALFIGLALILEGIPSLVGGLWRANAGTINENGGPAVLASAVGGLLAYLGSVVLQVAITRATVSDLVGERPDFAACLKAGLVLVLPMIGLTIVAGLGVGFATLLLIVPGIMLYVAWSVAVPAYVQERIGVFASFDRSRGLTRGNRWKIFAILVVWWIIAALLQAPADMLMLAAHVPAYAQVLITTLVEAVTAMVLATLQAAIYVELRDVKEGVLPQDLEAIFA